MDQTSKERWSNVRTYDEALEANVSYLLGDEIRTTPYHGPLEDKTLVPGLVRLNKLRLLTYMSQPFEQINGEHYDGECYDHWQKPFVSFFMADEDNPLRLLQKLKEHADICSLCDKGKSIPSS